MNCTSKNILHRMGVFDDSEMLANLLRHNPEKYALSEAAAHIDGLWNYTLELAGEIKRLQQMLEKRFSDIPTRAALSNELTASFTNHPEMHISEENHVCIPECQSPRSAQPIEESSLQKLALIQNCENHHVQERAKCSEEGAFCLHETKVQPHVCSEPQYEYLTLALPMKPNDSVQIYGQSKNTPTQFLPLAELSLTMLRDQAIRMANASPRAVRDQFDTLSHAAIDLINAMNSPSARHHSKEGGH
ncbi:hypothetical protein [Dryocola sp. BD626]|uniref:hypothetical protein n=1 Tax=Dryocola sp. BD626 TaxID=3133273 RepID=UPI003F501A9A